MNGPLTLAEWCSEWGLSLDAVRQHLHRNPGLRELGRPVGSARIYTPDEARRIQESFLAKARRPALPQPA